MKRVLWLLALVSAGWLAPAGGAPGASWSIDLEGGIAAAGYNDIAVPGDAGTRFSFTDDLATRANRYWRLRLGRDLGSRGHLSALIAPLRLAAKGTAPMDVLFEDRAFAAGTTLEGQYRFDSYRLTYRYDFHAGGTWRLGAGLSAKIRDAEIRLEGADVKAATRNTGFVPLIHFRADWTPRPAWSLVCEGDALIGPQGRAEDVFLGAAFRVRPELQLKAGYRILEGGADVEQAYNFALVHYLSLGAVMSL
ncbi:MAG: hypothetical protein FJY75_01270 [Candidatus Eisenbacteria bacterium]|uniref:DUF2490 domain-containing protein n=1 Tax=Eiseniibacteriota bacterium TaxID=2212470 RepID=A0A938BMS5_UNCEI|nr:hypothetical protein [Candidatus Eisenbacteria bacterium]